MHIDLAQLDSEALELVSSPPGTPSEAQQHVRLSQLRGLSGQLSKTRDSLRLSSAHAKEAVIDALSLAFGRVALTSAGKARLSHVVAQYQRGQDHGADGALHLELVIMGRRFDLEGCASAACPPFSSTWPACGQSACF